MAILRAIGAFFARIWRWIKETAWVQPLLIVGIIFGVVFSIPSIVDAAREAKSEKNKSEAYYTKFQYSLVGGEESDADKLTSDIYKKSKGDNVELSVGDKFFLVFVKQDCSICDEVKEGFEALENGFGEKATFLPEDKRDFKMVTIYADEKMEDSDEDKDESAFEKYLDRNEQFFIDASSNGADSYYYLNGHIQDSDLEVLGEIDPVNFLTPTILLIDFTATSPTKGVSEVTFGVEGSSAFDKAQTLLDCWNHAEEFAKKN